MKYTVPKVRPIADGRTSGVLWKAALTSCCQFYQDLGFYCTCIKNTLNLLSLTIWFILCGIELPSSFIFERLQLQQSNTELECFFSPSFLAPNSIYPGVFCTGAGRSHLWWGLIRRLSTAVKCSEMANGSLDNLSTGIWLMHALSNPKAS